MNLSGEAVIDAVNYFKIKPENIIVVVDDIHIPLNLHIVLSTSFFIIY